MTSSLTVIDVFLSSPTDVEEERTFIKQLALEWNTLRSRQTGSFLSVTGWEERVAPALSERPQASVNEQVGQSYDVYLGLMWNRFGTPTGPANSGTEEEFNLALSRVRNGAAVRMALLFKKGLVDPDLLDFDQLQRVRNFKERASSEGAFYREFSDENSLRAIVNLLFEQIVADKDKYAVNIDHKKMEAEIKTTSSIDDDMGLIEIGEKFSDLSDQLVSDLETVADAEHECTSSFISVTDKIKLITESASHNPASIKQLIGEAASAMNRVAKLHESKIDGINESLQQMGDLANLDVRVRLEFEGRETVASGNIDAMRGLLKTVTDAIVQLDDLISETSKVPKLSTDLARSKRRLGNVRQQLRDSLQSFFESLHNAVMFFDERQKQ
jgi:hypothetical protein